MSSSSPIEAPFDAAAAPSSHRGRRWLIRAAFVAAVLATLLVAFYVEERVRGNWLWQRYEAEARGRGAKLTLAEVIPAPVAPERNFAEIPVFQDAFRTPSPPNPFSLKDETSGSKLPSLDAAGKDRPIDLAEWQKFFVTAGALPTAGEDAAADVLKALERFAPALDQLRRAADRPECRFPVYYEDGVSAILPHLPVIQQASRLPGLSIAAHLAHGETELAYADFRLGLRLYQALRHEPTLIAGLVRLGVLGVIENAVWGGLERQQWNDETLAKIGADLGDVRLMDDYALAVESERGFSNLVHDQMMGMNGREIEALVGLTQMPGPGPNPWPRAAAFMFYPRGWIRMSQVRTNRYMDEALARVSQDPPRIHPERATLSGPEGAQSTGTVERLRYMLSFLFMPALRSVEGSYAYNQTLLDECRLGCALERHRLAQGIFPRALEEVAPAFLPAIPRDVMTGEALHYATAADGGYTLYGVGIDLRDDGGRTDAKGSGREQPDWVWRIRAPAGR